MVGEVTRPPAWQLDWLVIARVSWIAITLVGIAALFNPLRRRVQVAIDLRCRRQGYDTQKILESFYNNARSDAVLASLNVELVRAARDSLRPEHISLWLKPAIQGNAMKPVAMSSTEKDDQRAG